MRTALRLLVVLVVLCVGGEVVTRALITSPSAQQFDEVLGWVYVPHACVYSSKEGGARLCFNSLGLNDDEVSDKNGRFRILALGDSFTEATHVPREQNFTSLLEQFYAPRLDVINAARNGFNVIQYLARLRSYKNALDADMIMVVLSQGELGDLRAAKNLIISRGSNGVITGVGLKSDRTSEIKRTLEPLLQRSALITHLMRRIKPIVTDARDDLKALLNSSEPPSIAVNMANKPCKNCIETSEQAKELMGFVLAQIAKIRPLLVISIPDITYTAGRKAELLNGKQRAHRQLALDAGASYVEVSTPLMAVYTTTGQPANGFNNSQKAQGHLNPAGHQAVAQAVAHWLQKNISGIGQKQ
ncbi:MAG: hypothetical protein GXP10_01420 [Gammaproteobacteria bacterium]|nr:hypothetical protein [Gammaproteobacteria bacterium]